MNLGYPGLSYRPVDSIWPCFKFSCLIVSSYFLADNCFVWEWHFSWILLIYVNYDSMLQRLSLFLFLNTVSYFLLFIFSKWLTSPLFDFCAVMFFKLLFFWLLCNGWRFHCLTFCAEMIPCDSFIWFYAMMFFLCLLRNDLLLLRNTGLSAVWATIARFIEKNKSFYFFFKTGEGVHKFNNLFISKRMVPWRRSSKWRKTGAQGNIRILRSRNTWGQQRECKRKRGYKSFRPCSAQSMTNNLQILVKIWF